MWLSLNKDMDFEVPKLLVGARATDLKWLVDIDFSALPSLRSTEDLCFWMTFCANCLVYKEMPLELKLCESSDDPFWLKLTLLSLLDVVWYWERELDEKRWRYASLLTAIAPGAA